MTLPIIVRAPHLDAALIRCWCGVTLTYTERELCSRNIDLEREKMWHLHSGPKHQPPPLPVEYQ